MVQARFLEGAELEGRLRLSALCGGTDWQRNPPPAPPSVDEESSGTDFTLRDRRFIGNFQASCRLSVAFMLLF